MYSASYYCGVNILGGDDHICGNRASPSGVGIDVNEPTDKAFEFVNANTVFPMLQINTMFSFGGTIGFKFRGGTCSTGENYEAE